MAHWNRPPMDRRQATLFAPTLDDSIAANHPVRLFDEVLGGFNFDSWESSYFFVAGQPPIHPGVLARCILYGLSQATEQDKSDDQLYGRESSPSRLPVELKDLKRRQEKLKRAMARLEQIEREQAVRGERSARGPAVPLADPDSRVLPNKTGGHAPNYTVVLAVDAQSGIILDSQILGGNDEASTVLPAVVNIQESFDRTPAQLLADSGFNTGPNLAELKQQGVEALMPPRQQADASAAAREDLSQPVAEQKWDSLPMNPQNKVLDKAAFAYDPSGDCYFCPMGKRLNYTEDKKYDRHGKKGVYRVYQCADCAGCPLAARCLAKQTPERRICRDAYEKDREEMSRRMNSEQGRKQYSRRAHAAETPHAAIKTKMNFRQFLLRGQTKVKQEWCWATTAYNLVKIVARKALHRANASLPAPIQPA